MATIAFHLSSLNGYPIPAPTLAAICESHLLCMDDEMNMDIARSTDYNLAKADVLQWLANAPNVTQGGQSFSLSEYQRKQLLAQADVILQDYGTAKPRYGYKGSRL